MEIVEIVNTSPRGFTTQGTLQSKNRIKRYMFKSAPPSRGSTAKGTDSPRFDVMDFQMP